jgi:flagellar motor protein MotB
MALFLLFVPVISHAQETRWYDDFFIEGSIHQYFAPEILDYTVQPKTGFRGALGYEYNRFRLAVESGYTKITGTGGMEFDMSLAPLILKFGYGLPILYGFGLQADLGVGFMFSRITHYDSEMYWLNLLKDNKQESKTGSPLMGARLYATYTIPQNFLKIYAGGGVDALFENDGPIPLPCIEAGVSFKPVMLIRPWVEKKKTAREGGIAPENLAFSDTPGNPAIEQDEHGKAVWLLETVYFETNNAVMFEQYRPILDEAGRRLQANTELRITLRGYTAPFGMAEGRAALSLARARYCRDYLKNSFDIAEERIIVEYYGAGKTPEFADETWESYRCVELIIE